MTRRRKAAIGMGLAGIVLAAAFALQYARDTETAGLRVASAMLREHCVDCHDSDTRSGELVLDPAALSDVAGHAEIFERVVRKLRARAMPPPDEPRPDDATYERVAGFLETSLDRAATEAPNPGRLPLLHRLSRTEYRNAIRDLLALDDLPREMDYELLLPADNASSGFDNIADLLFVSPVIMERYLEAARKISRLAVGDPDTPVMVNLHRMPLQLPQDEDVSGLPFGTRGGLAIDSYFPLDAEYVVRVEMQSAARELQEIEITVDGARAASGSIGPSSLRRQPPATLEFTVPVSAGPHRLGATFLRRTEALDESTVRVMRRSYGTLPAMKLVTLSGPFNATGPGDTPSRQRIFVCRPANSEQETPCARKILSSLLERAFRKPPSEADLDELWPFFEAGRSERGFDAGIQRALERMLVSPQFLFRIERVPEGTQPGDVFAINPIELASRLSFFLWSSIPDQELLDVAVSGRLSEPDVLVAQTRRMLADPRAESLITNFAAQWLFLHDVDTKDPDLFLFRDYDESLRAAFIKETELFVESIMREERSVLELITANYTFVNERLAKHYGIPYIRGSRFRRVDLPAGSPRGGLLGQGSILTLTSYPTRTSPVLRGKYVLDNLLASPPPPPPPNVPALEADPPKEGEVLSMQETMARHRANPDCANCHKRMDPIGFAFEQFDAVGHLRDDLDPSETVSELPDGTVLDGIEGVKALLLDSPERFVNAITEKLLMYALGRNIQYYDAPAVRAIVRGAAERNYTFQALIEGIVTSVPFRMRQLPADAAGKTVARLGSTESSRLEVN